MASVEGVGAVGSSEDVSQVQRMFDERLQAERESTTTMSDQIQKVAAENLQAARSPDQQAQSLSGGLSSGEVQDKLKEFVARFSQIVDQNSAFNIRIGLGVTEAGDPLIRIIDKQSQETVETIPAPQAIKLASNMELFTDYFVQKFSSAGPLMPGALVNMVSS